MQEICVLGKANRFPLPHSADFAATDRGAQSVDPGWLGRTCAREWQLRVVRIQNAAPRQDHALAANLVGRFRKLMSRRHTLLLLPRISPSRNQKPREPLPASAQSDREIFPLRLFRRSLAAPLPKRGLPREELFRSVQVRVAEVRRTLFRFSPCRPEPPHRQPR